MNDIHFVVEEAPEGGWTARALAADIFTEADELSELHACLRDAVSCHFDEGERPALIHIHINRREVIAAWGCPEASPVLA